MISSECLIVNEGCYSEFSDLSEKDTEFNRGEDAICNDEMVGFTLKGWYLPRVTDKLKIRRNHTDGRFTIGLCAVIL